MAVDPSTGHEFAELPETAPGGGRRAGRGRPPGARGRDRTGARRSSARGRCCGSRAGSRRRRRTLADFETRDTGKPLSQAQADVRGDVRYLEYYAGSIERLEGRTIPLGPDALDYTRARAVGRVRADHPVELPAAGRRPLRRAGAGGGQRGDPQAVRAGVDHAAAARAIWPSEAGVPRGMFQVATGDGSDRRRARRQPGVDHVTFVGSAATGAKVAEACARRLDAARARARRQVAERRLRRRRPRQGRARDRQVAAAERRPELLGGLAAAGRATRSTTRSIGARGRGVRRR